MNDGAAPATSNSDPAALARAAEAARLAAEAANARADKGSDNDKAALHAEAAAYRIEAKKAKEAAEAAEKRADRAEKEKEKAVEAARTEGSTAAEKFKKRAIASELKAAAVDAGIEDVDLLPLIQQKYGDKFLMDDEGNISGIAEAVDAFKKDKPLYFKKPTANNNGGTGEGGRKTGSDKNPNPATKIEPKKVKEMDAKEYAEFKRKEMAALKK